MAARHSTTTGARRLMKLRCRQVFGLGSRPEIKNWEGSFVDLGVRRHLPDTVSFLRSTYHRALSDCRLADLLLDLRRSTSRRSRRPALHVLDDRADQSYSRVTTRRPHLHNHGIILSCQTKVIGVGSETFIEDFQLIKTDSSVHSVDQIQPQTPVHQFILRPNERSQNNKAVLAPCPNKASVH